MRRKITEAHLLLIITFAMYMGYQWLMQWIPLHDVMFHVIMGQVMLIFPGALWMLIRYRKNRPQLSERMLFTPISNANIKMAVAVIISAYPVVVILNRFLCFCEKPGDGSYALYDENGVFSNAVCDGSDASV